MRRFRLWFLFVLTVSVTMISSFFATGLVAYRFIRPSIAPGPPRANWIPFISFAMTSILVAIALTLFVSRRFFLPINNIIRALQKVAGGDFSVRLPEDVRQSEVLDMNLNFNKMVKELSSMEMLKTDFMQNVSHEFKTPLSSIEGYAVLLNAAKLPEELHTYTQRILESTKQLSSLTGNILKLSKLENQEIVSEKEDFWLDEQLRQAVLSLEPLWSRKELEIDIDLPEVSYYANENLLFQVWINLLSNAIKFTPDGGTIVVKAVSQADCILVQFKDTGIGMSQEAQLHMFDKFYQADRNRSVEGNGLGLTLVRKIVDLCEGSIDVMSELGGGTMVLVRLPWVEKET